MPPLFSPYAAAAMTRRYAPLLLLLPLPLDYAFAATLR